MRKVNVEGVIHATRAVMESMRARRYGRIVNLASIAAIGTALSGNAFYAATKAEVVILTRRFAWSLASTASRCGGSKEHIGRHSHQLGRVAPHALFIAASPTIVDRNVASLPPPEPLQPF
jgi:hypothetical protein